MRNPAGRRFRQVFQVFDDRRLEILELRYKSDMSTEPDLAESWSVASNNLTWTFKPKKSVAVTGSPILYTGLVTPSSRV